MRRNGGIIGRTIRMGMQRWWGSGLRRMWRRLGIRFEVSWLRMMVVAAELVGAWQDLGRARVRREVGSRSGDLVPNRLKAGLRTRESIWIGLTGRRGSDRVADLAFSGCGVFAVVRGADDATRRQA